MVLFVLFALAPASASEPVSLELEGWTAERTEQGAHLHVAYSKGTTPCTVELDRWMGLGPARADLEATDERPVIVGGKSEDLVTTPSFGGRAEEAQVVRIDGEGFEARLVFRQCSQPLVDGISERVVVQRTELVAAEGVALPWTLLDLRNDLAIGGTWTYERTGRTAAGAAIRETRSHEVTQNTDAYLVVREVTRSGGATTASSNKARSWDSGLPYERKHVKSVILGTEEVTVPAGTFSTVKVRGRDEISGVDRTWWAIVDKPGVYARIEQHAPDKAVAELTSVSLK